MNRIIREHYPASLLPTDLRDAIGEGKQVTIIVEDDAAKTKEPCGEGGWFSRHKHVRHVHFHTSEEVNEHIRSLRDEWSHRER